MKNLSVNKYMPIVVNRDVVTCLIHLLKFFLQPVSSLFFLIV